MQPTSLISSPPVRLAKAFVGFLFIHLEMKKLGYSFNGSLCFHCHFRESFICFITINRRLSVSEEGASYLPSVFRTSRQTVIFFSTRFQSVTDFLNLVVTVSLTADCQRTTNSVYFIMPEHPVCLLHTPAGNELLKRTENGAGVLVAFIQNVDVLQQLTSPGSFMLCFGVFAAFLGLLELMAAFRLRGVVKQTWSENNLRLSVVTLSSHRSLNLSHSPQQRPQILSPDQRRVCDSLSSV